MQLSEFLVVAVWEFPLPRVAALQVRRSRVRHWYPKIGEWSARSDPATVVTDVQMVAAEPKVGEPTFVPTANQRRVALVPAVLVLGTYRPNQEKANRY